MTHSTTRRPWASRALAAAALLLTPLLVVLPTVSAEPVTRALTVTLIGDSYSAGNGAGDYYGPAGSYRSSNNWAHRYVDWLNTQGVHTTLKNVAYSGSVTDDLLNEQVIETAGSDLVMLTIGGNDVEFSTIVQECFALGLRDPWSCEELVGEAEDGLDGVVSATEDILQKISDTATDGKDPEVILVGYPLLSMDTDYVLAECRGSSWGPDTDCSFYEAAQAVRDLGDTATSRQRDLVAAWNASHDLKVSYVPVNVAFEGHEPDPSVLRKNDYRWINEFWETEGVEGPDGKTVSEFADFYFTGEGPSHGQMNWYHPNLIGHQKIADEIAATVGIPESTRPVIDGTGVIDIAFVVDTTGSMSDDIAAIRSDIASIVDQVEAQSSSARFALVTYRDFQSETGWSGDYPSRLEQDFTSDTAALRSALDALTINGGGDYPESVYSGVMEAVGLTWRDGVRKIAVVLGDAPPKDPEPETGYTAASVAAAAYAVDPVEVYAVDTGAMASAPMADLVEQSGGRIFTPDSVSEIAALFVAAANDSLAKPYAWIQGPYLAKVGETVELDARASYGVGASLVSYEWDLDGDGDVDRTSAGPVLEHRFTELFDGVVGVRVTDSAGRTGVGSTLVTITDDGDNTPREIDNCPDVDNHGQEDDDEDGVGDLCDETPGYPTQDAPGIYEFDSADDVPTGPGPGPGDGPGPGPGDGSGETPGPEPTDGGGATPPAPTEGSGGASPPAGGAGGGSGSGGTRATGPVVDTDRLGSSARTDAGAPVVAAVAADDGARGWPVATVLALVGLLTVLTAATVLVRLRHARR